MIVSKRREFPFLDGDNPCAYPDNGASTQKPRAVIERMRQFAGREYANVHRGIHELSERSTAVYEGSRERARSFFNAATAESIVFTRGTTEAVNLVAFAWGGHNAKSGDTILLSEMEHHSIMVPWQQLAARTEATSFRSSCGSWMTNSRPCVSRPAPARFARRQGRS